MERVLLFLLTLLLSVLLVSGAKRWTSRWGHDPSLVSRGLEVMADQQGPCLVQIQPPMYTDVVLTRFETDRASWLG